jgi:amino acid transporter
LRVVGEASYGRDQGAMSELRRQISLGEGIVFALGSLAGAGLLFLPSMTYAIAGADVGIVWLIGTALAVPLLWILSDMVIRVPGGSGIEGFISLGLGERFGGTVPALFLGILFCGEAASAYVGGEFVARALGQGIGVQRGFMLLCTTTSFLIPYAGLTTGKRIQQAVTWGTLLLAFGLLVLGVQRASAIGFAAITPVFGPPRLIFHGVLAAFFAYIGLENMTFIAGEF